MEDFIYTPLSTDTSDPEIRLLGLDPANFDDRITCSLRHARLSSNPSYDALSYYWGTTPPSKAIVCNGKRLVITETLHAALQRLREPPAGHIRHLWADAICINQSDTPEKNIQVGHMLQIYSKADCVSAWLGPADHGVCTAMSRLEKIGVKAQAAGIRELGPHWHSNSTPISWWDGTANASLEPRLAKICDALNELSDEFAECDPYAGMNDLIKLKYWYRVWIVQEFVVSKQLRLLCGTTSLSFDILAASMLFESWHGIRHRRWREAMLSKNQREAIQFGNLISLIGAKRRRSGELGKPPDTLFELLIRTCLGNTLTCDQRASDKRDLVYGLISMAIDCHELGIDIDYRKSVQEVFTDAARALIHRGYLSILAWNQFPKELPNLPSWVPDLSNPISEACGEHRHHKIHQAAGPQSSPLLPTTFPPFSSPSQGFAPLSLTCYPIDVIGAVGNPWKSDNTFKAAATNAYLGQIEDFANKRPPYSSHLDSASLLRQTRERWSEAFWRVPTADQAYSGVRNRADQAMFTSYSEVRKLMVCGDPVDEAADRALAEGLCNLSRDAVFYCMSLGYQISRKPLLSKMGYIGLVPRHALPGDQLVIVEGASVPYVFRKRSDSIEGWELIGEAYIDGLMDGEVLQDGHVASEVFQVY